MKIQAMLIETGGKMLGKIKDEGSARFIGCLTEEINAAIDDRKRIAFYKSLNEDIEEKRRSLNSPYLDSQEFENFCSDCNPFDRLMKHIDAPKCSNGEKIAEIVRDAKTHNSKLTVYDYSPLENLCKFVIAKYEEFLKETDLESYNRSMTAKEAIAQENRLHGFILESEKNICERIDERGHATIPNDPIRPWIPPTVDGLELTYRYKTNMLPLIGRDDEMETLRDFCNASTPFLWYAICGPGGMGKSRLAYEFAIEMRNEEWTVYWLKSTDYKYLSDMSFEGKDNVLIVADYVLMHTKEIAECIQRLESINTKIRLLLLERANKKLRQSSEKDENNQDFSAKIMQDYPLWMSLQLESSRLKYSLFKDGPLEFMFLNVLPDEQIKEVIKKYARIIAPSKELSGDDCKKIFDRLKEIDKKFRRPLYARVIVLLWSRDANWQTCSNAELMEKIFYHEMDRWKEYLKDTTTKRAQKQLLEMLAIVTMNDGMTENEMKTYHLNLYDEMKLYLREEDVVSFFDDNEMLETNSNGEDILCAVEPDLFGEYLVLKWLDQGPRQHDRLNILFNKGWSGNPDKYQFIDRFIHDYGSLLNVAFWDRLFAIGEYSQNYYEILLHILEDSKIDTKLLEKTISLLLEITCKVDEDDHEHYWLTVRREMFLVCQCEHDFLNYPPYRIISDLGKITKKYPYLPVTIAALRSQILMLFDSDYRYRYDVHVVTESYEEIKKIYMENKDIALSFNEISKYIPIMQKLMCEPLHDFLIAYSSVDRQTKKSVCALTRYYAEEYKYTHEINTSDSYSACAYSAALEEFCEWEDLMTKRKYTEELKMLHERFHYIIGITERYAYALVKLCASEEKDECIKCVKTLNTLFKSTNNKRVKSLYNEGKKILARRFHMLIGKEDDFLS